MTTERFKKLDEETFNRNIRLALNKLLKLKSEGNLDKNQGNDETTCEIFVHLNKPLAKNSVKQEINDDRHHNYENETNSSFDSNVSLNELRLLLLVNMLAKFIKKRIKIYLSQNVKSNYKENLEKIFKYFNLQAHLEFEEINLSQERVESIESKLKHLNSRFIIESPIECANDSVETNSQRKDLIDFTKIIEQFNLKYYDKNLKYGQVNTENIELLLAYNDFLNTTASLNKTNRILNVCLNSEFYQRQKIDLVSRALNTNDSVTTLTNSSHQHLNYVCVGCVKSERNDESDANFHIDSREKYFNYAANQRQIISNDLLESNVKNFTRFSFAFDLLSVNHQNDIKKFKKFSLDDECLAKNDNDDEIDEIKCLTDESSFILYNCARLNAIIEKFENLKSQGVYSQSMSAINELNFYLLLKTDFERKLCEQHLFVYEKILDELSKSIYSLANGSLQTKLNLPKLFRFLVDLSNLFSKYYNKIHILEDPKVVHLHETMHARIYLLKSIYNLFELFLSYFNISPIKRI